MMKIRSHFPLLTATATAFRSPHHSRPSFQTTRRHMLTSISEAIVAHRDDGIFVDGSWHMPNTRDAREEFRRGPRVAGARYFDIDTVWCVWCLLGFYDALIAMLLFLEKNVHLTFHLSVHYFPPQNDSLTCIVSFLVLCHPTKSWNTPAIFD
jgi:hypothetical protein